jgi:hypothetical protein
MRRETRSDARGFGGSAPEVPAGLSQDGEGRRERFLPLLK